MAEKIAGTERFYGLLNWLATITGGPRFLKDCHGRMAWPKRGVYFFLESGEHRRYPEGRSRVVRVGTHGMISGSNSTLWGRLSQHRGVIRTGLGNHRGSIFRLLVGLAIAERNGLSLPQSWGVGGSSGVASRRLSISREAVKAAESELECLVSQYIGQMPFLWLAVPDAPGPASRRGFIEQNSIALLSNYNGTAVDEPSSSWLGWYSDRKRVRLSGLWNNDHVDKVWDPEFLDEMEACIEAML